MRDTGDMMEDALSEDTMMECGGDESALDDLVDLSNEISQSAPTIRDAAERLLTLLGVEDAEDDFLSSSEDEGVELDEGSDDDDEEPGNTRLLHQLAASLAEELKYSQKQSNSSLNSSCTRSHQRVVKSFNEISKERFNDQFQSMEVARDISHQEDTKKSQKFSPSDYVDQTIEYKSTMGRNFYAASNSLNNASSMSPRKFRSGTRLRLGSDEDEKSVLTGEVPGLSGSWAAGWDACAAEAIRYLVEEEGLSPNHPTVLAMKSHLEIQKERALAQYAM